MASFDYDVVIVGSGFGGSVAALRAAEKGYRRLRGNGVPVVVVGDQVIHGYDPGAMEDALRPWLQ